MLFSASINRTRVGKFLIPRVRLPPVTLRLRTAVLLLSIFALFLIRVRSILPRCLDPSRTMRLAASIAVWASLATLLSAAPTQSAHHRVEKKPKAVLAASSNPDDPSGEPARRPPRFVMMRIQASSGETLEERH